jgi:hypothetical protein
MVRSLSHEEEPTFCRALVVNVQRRSARSVAIVGVAQKAAVKPLGRPDTNLSDAA